MKEHKHREKYGAWAGKPEGNKPNLEHCAQEITDSQGWHFHQCSRKIGHGPNGIYCKQHAKRYNT